MAEQNGKGRGFLIGAVVGGVLGAAAAILFAPKPGKEMRADLAESLQQVSGKTQDLASKVSGKTQEISKQIGSQTGEWVQKAKEVVGTVSDEVKAWRESRKEAAETEDEEMPANAEVLVAKRVK